MPDSVAIPLMVNCLDTPLNTPVNPAGKLPLTSDTLVELSVSYTIGVIAVLIHAV